MDVLEEKCGGKFIIVIEILLVLRTSTGQRGIPPSRSQDGATRGLMLAFILVEMLVDPGLACLHLVMAWPVHYSSVQLPGGL